VDAMDFGWNDLARSRLDLRLLGLGHSESEGDYRQHNWQTTLPQQTFQATSRQLTNVRRHLRIDLDNQAVAEATTSDQMAIGEALGRSSLSPNLSFRLATGKHNSPAVRLLSMGLLIQSKGRGSPGTASCWRLRTA